MHAPPSIHTQLSTDANLQALQPTLLHSSIHPSHLTLGSFIHSHSPHLTPKKKKTEQPSNTSKPSKPSTVQHRPPSSIPSHPIPPVTPFLFFLPSFLPLPYRREGVWVVWVAGEDRAASYTKVTHWIPSNRPVSHVDDHASTYPCNLCPSTLLYFTLLNGRTLTPPLS